MAEEILPPTLQNVLDQKSLKWIFCGMFLQSLCLPYLSNSHYVARVVQVERVA